MTPLAQFLSSLGLDAYIARFEEAGVTLEELPKLSPQELNTDLGMSFADRKKLIAALAGGAPAASVAPIASAPSPASANPWDAAPGPGPSASAAVWGAASPPAPAASAAVWGAAPAAPSTSGAAWGPPPASTPSPTASLLAPGMSVGGFTVRSELGKGAYAEVYQATDEASGEELALKVIPLYAGWEGFVRAFAGDFATFQKVRHPNLLAAERPRPANANGVDLLVLPTELADGGTLRARMASDRPAALDSDEGMSWLRESIAALMSASRGLAALHAAGRAHLDVRPENLLQVRGAWKLGDFGLARDVESVRRAGVVAPGVESSVAYMAPEHFTAARPQDVGPEADVWSFGVVLYELIDGHPPYAGSDDQVASHLRSGRKPNLRSLPKAWKSCIEALLTLEPADRPAASDIEARLKHALKGYAEEAALARAEAERKAHEEAERKAREEAERIARLEAEQKAREEAERQAKAEAERKERERKEAEERKVREAREKAVREERERKEAEEAARKAAEAAERKAKAAAERKEREAREKVEREERERRDAEEAAREAAAAAERKAKAAAARKEKAAREKAEQEERERKEAEEAAARKAREEAERKAKAEAERLDAERKASELDARDAAIRATKKTFNVRVERQVVESEGFLGFGKRVRADVFEASFDMIELPAGTVVMGSPADEPGRPLSGVRLDSKNKSSNGTVLTLTNAEGNVLEARHGDEVQWVAEVAPFAISVVPVTVALLRLFKADVQPLGDDHPADLSDVWLVNNFCNFLSEKMGLTPAYLNQFSDAPIPGANGFRRPTVVEWTYAATAGRTFDAAALGDIAWHSGNSGGHTHPVGKKRANAWGLHDVFGNVWEPAHRTSNPLHKKVYYSFDGSKAEALSYEEIAARVVGRKGSHKVHDDEAKKWLDVTDVPEVAWALWERMYSYGEPGKPVVPMTAAELAVSLGDRSVEGSRHSVWGQGAEKWAFTRCEDLPSLTTILKKGPPPPLARHPSRKLECYGPGYRGGCARTASDQMRLAGILEFSGSASTVGLRLARSLP